MFINWSSMISLQDSSFLPLTFDERDNAIFFPDEAKHGGVDRVKLGEMSPILLNRTLVYPDKVYTEYKDVGFASDQDTLEKHDLHYNILVLPTGLLGVEYTKTHIYTTEHDEREVICIAEVIKGGGTLLMQKIEPKDEYDFDTSVSEVNVVKIKPKERVPIPNGYQYCFINTRNQPLVLSRVFRHDGRIDYRTIRKERGMAYYVIRKNARQEYVKNPRYRTVPKLTRSKPETYQNKFNLTSSKPLYQQIIQDPKRFKNILG